MSMVITFSLDMVGGLMFVVGLPLGVEVRGGLSLGVEVRGLSLDVEVRGGLSLGVEVRGD